MGRGVTPHTGAAMYEVRPFCRACAGTGARHTCAAASHGAISRLVVNIRQGTQRQALPLATRLPRLAGGDRRKQGELSTASVAPPSLPPLGARADFDDGDVSPRLPDSDDDVGFVDGPWAPEVGEVDA